MDILFQGSVAKHLDSPEDNEDAYRVAAENGRIVLCDGASESFDGKNWARLLTGTFTVQSPASESLASCMEAFEALHDPANLSWSKAAAYERGSFATALIAQDEPAKQQVTIQAIGDSFAILTDGRQLLKSFPYRRSEEFEGKPHLISTLAQHNAYLNLSSEKSAIPTIEWSYAEGGPLFLICMTDALGAWLLRCLELGDEFSLERLFDIRSDQALAELVEQERSEKRMRSDDSTLVIALL